MQQDISEELAALQRQIENCQNDSPHIDEEEGFVRFSEQEILQMPTKFRKLFRLGGVVVRAYKRISCVRGKKVIYNYELRCRSNGYDVYASSNDFDEAKQKFLKNLKVAEIKATNPKIPTTFHEFATFYFEKYRTRLVKPLTLKNDKYRYKNHLQPRFKSLPLSAIDSDSIQDFIDEYVDNGEIKNAKELKSLLSCIFTNAVNHGILQRNPCRLVIVENYESEHGTALTIDEENALIEGLKDNPKYLIPIAVALYTGIRPCEYRTATIEGNFIRAEVKKQHTKKIVYKYIPIIPRLKKILNGTTELYFPNKKYLRDKLVAICPNHKLYDLRTTFDTRCEMFHVADLARQFWMGHSINKLRKAYADLPAEYFLKEAEKLNY